MNPTLPETILIGRDNIREIGIDGTYMQNTPYPNESRPAQFLAITSDAIAGWEACNLERLMVFNRGWRRGFMAGACCCLYFVAVCWLLLKGLGL